MTNLSNYVGVFIEFLPLWLVLVIGPALLFNLYLNRLDKKRLQRIMNDVTVLPLSIDATNAYTLFVYGVLLAPFAEEILFRGVPLLIHPFFAMVGTAAWVLVHPVKFLVDYQYLLSKSELLQLTVFSTLFFTSCGIFLLLIWLRGFEYGAIAIIYHMLYNAFVFVGVVSSESKKPKQAAGRRVETPEPRQPLPAPAMRKVLREVGLETSVSASPEKLRRILRKADGHK